MSDTAPIGGSYPVDLNQSRPSARRSTPAAPIAPTGKDQVELSRTAQLLSKLAELPDIREDLVARVRTEIQAGTYESEEKLEAALQGLMDDLS